MDTNKYNIHPKVREIMRNRGVETDEDLASFLNPTDKFFYDPFLLSGMQKLVDRINFAVNNNEKILIFGDYDVDGVSATAILVRFFATQNVTVDYYLPNRYVDGYGLTNDTIDKVKKLYDPKLIITVDCGIACAKEVEYAKTLGIDIVVTDHHDIQGGIPNTIVVDPKLEGQNYPFNALCGTGVAFKVVQALAGLDIAKDYLGICAIATIADIVPLVDENRAIVKLGMQNFKDNLPIGIKMLFKENKMDFLSADASDIAFKLSPKINAAGRMGDAGVALKLYLLTDEVEIKETIAKLIALNTERQDICAKVYDDVAGKLSKINISNYNSIALYSKHWDSGILGIVAAKIAGEFNRPTILLAEEDGYLRGSARSVNDIDIFTAISSIKGVLETFGGHKMAAGLTIKKDNFKYFLTKLNEYLANNYSPNDFIKKTEFDMTLTPSDVTAKFMNDLKLLEPCGCGNAKPVFDFEISGPAVIQKMPKHPSHLMIKYKNLSFVAFNFGDYSSVFLNADDKHIITELMEEEYKGKKRFKGIARDLLSGKITRPKEKDCMLGEYIKQLSFCGQSYDKKLKVYDKNFVKNLAPKLKNELFGTLFVAYSQASYNELCDKLGDIQLNHYFGCVASNSGLNSVVLCPTSFDNFGAYKRVILLDTVLCDGFIKELSMHTGANIFIPSGKVTIKNAFDGLKVDRQTFAVYYKILLSVSRGHLAFTSDYALYKMLQKTNKTITYKQFILTLYVFLELGIFTKSKDASGVYSLFENKKVLSKLSLSKMYCQASLLVKTN